MHGDNFAIAHKEPQHPGIEIAHVSQLKELITERFRLQRSISLFIS
jgi:hypothetical protein